MRLFLCGDVMTGRGIDQILPTPCDPSLYEPHVRSALTYVELAERASGAIPRSVPFDYIWGEALDEMERREPDFSVINLETSITADGDPEPKGINYRMHPGNVGCITAAGIGCCVVANNHVGDWGPGSLKDTLVTLHEAGIATAGAGSDAQSAARPAILERAAGKRLLVFALGCPSSGVPIDWAAGENRPGVNLLPNFSKEALEGILRGIDAFRRPEDAVLVSIHWGPNWGHDVSLRHQHFARELIDSGRVDIIHGHSSHHPLAIEIHAGKPILYGCGDFINDYEGIGGHERFRPDLTAAYFVDLDDRDRRLQGMELVPFRLQRFRLVRAGEDDRDWLARTLDRECRRFGRRIRVTGQGTLAMM